jgi:hypothetical protein
VELTNGIRNKLALLLAGEQLDSPQQLIAFDREISRTVSSWEMFQRTNQVVRDRKARYREYERMDEMSSDVHASLDSYAEEATMKNREKDRTVWVFSDNQGIVEEAHRLFDRLKIEDSVYAIARCIAKYGDDFERIYYDESGVIHWQWTEPWRVDRICDDQDRLRGYTVTGMQGVSATSLHAKANPWDFIHFRISGSDRKGWGESLLSGLSRTWRILDQLETALALYRLHRAADRVIFYVDVGGASQEQSYEIVNRWRQMYRKRKHFDDSKGEVDFKHNPIDVLEDIFWPVRKESTSKVDKLPGSSNVGDIADIEMWRNKLRYGLRIPKGYWGDDDGGVFDAKAGLVAQDMKFARGVERIQRAVVNGITKMLQIHLALIGQNPSQDRFKVRMEPVSYLMEMQRMEALQQRIIVLQGLVEVGVGLGLDPEAWSEYLLKTVMFTTDDEFVEFLEGQAESIAERQKQATEVEAEQFSDAKGAAKNRANKPGGQSGGKSSKGSKEKATTDAKSKKTRIADGTTTSDTLTEQELEALQNYVKENKGNLKELKESIERLEVNGVVVDIY